MTIEELNTIIPKHKQKFRALKEEMGKVVVGQEHLIDRLLIAILADGHLLLEGLPGLAKTLSVTTLAKALNCDFKRIQFTPDLLPTDLIGTSIYHPKDGTFQVKKGPIFTNIVLADEINRAPAKVQSALLEVMGERQMTVNGETFICPKPYLVLATQNPIEQEGTYPLPEAQTDRFMMKVLIGYPSYEEEIEILKRMGSLMEKPQIAPVLKAEDILEARRIVDQVYIDDKVIRYLLDIVFATRGIGKLEKKLKGMLEHGASPRASIALILASKAHAFLDGRAFVTPYDIKEIGHDILRHRIKLSYEGEAEELTSDDIIETIFETISPP